MRETCVSMSNCYLRVNGVPPRLDSQSERVWTKPEPMMTNENRVKTAVEDTFFSELGLAEYCYGKRGELVASGGSGRDGYYGIP